MADNYQEFSEVIPNLSKEEAAWLKDQLEIIVVFDGEEFTDDALPENRSSDEADWIGCRALRDMEDYESGAGADAGFQYEFRDSDDETLGRHLWVYAHDWGYVDNVAHLVRKFLKQFRPDDCWSLTWSETCSKPRVGQFGGGAVFVTASDVAWGGSCDFVEQQRAVFASSETAAESDVVQPGPYHLTIDGPAFRKQRELLQRLRGFAAAKMPYWPAPGEVESLEGLIELTDEMADQAHDVHGIDCLLDAGKADPQ
jgi:hypothetical protein